jgi:uncharacterized membrane protein
MLNYHVTFQSPWYLLLWPVLAAAMLWWSRRSLAPLGFWRWLSAVTLRALVLAILVAAVAEIQMVRTSDRLTVIYLLDQSESIPPDNREVMVDYVNAAIRKHRQHEDRAGVIVFGRDAAIEVPPFDDDVQLPKIESLLDPNYTDLARAMRLAQASFPEDAAKRIVMVTDGNENLGDAIREAQALSGGGVGIDVVPVRYAKRGEVIVERVTMPSDVRRGQPFDLKVVLSNTRGEESAPESAPDTPSVRGTATRGRLRISKWLGDQSVRVSEEDVVLPPGKRVLAVRQEIDATGFYTYKAEFLPDNPADDTMDENNEATAFANVRGRGQVLVIEDSQNPGEFERMKQALARQNLEVTERTSDQPFAGLAELQQYDTVVLANVPREDFSDAQISMLVRNTQQMGAGLVMLGGPNSFGAGGWTNTELEKAMPVDFQIKNAKIVPRGALAMVMHASEMAQGNFWQKKIAQEALNALGSRDYCGVIHYGNTGRTEWLWKPAMCEVGGNRNQMLARLGQMVPGDMPDFDPGMVMAQVELSKLPDAAVKHMIIISDGDPSPPKNATLSALANSKITVSTVAVGTHGAPESQLMAEIAEKTGGKYYKVLNANALPRIFQREARRVAQPLIYENSAGFRPQLRFPHEMLSGIDRFEPITGFVMTSVKENPLVEVSAISPLPTNEKNATILASWTYGLGKSVAFTTDAGARYARSWTAWEDYDKFFGQMIRWSMRPVDEEGKFTVATDVGDGEVRVVVTALDKDDEFMNFLDMSGTVVGPDLEPLPMKMEQTAPGRYVGSFATDNPGAYFLMVSPGAGKAPLRTGVNVPYSDEFRGRPTNDALLGELARTAPENSPPGRLIDGLDEPGALSLGQGTRRSTLNPQLFQVDTFRHDLPKATSSQAIWQYMVLAACLVFFCDVFVRRVQVEFGWVAPLVVRVRDTILRRKPEPAAPPTMDRLRSRKAEVGTQVEKLRANARFEPAESEDRPADVAVLDRPTDLPAEPRPSSAPSLAKEPEKESYTERLLKAKKKAWQDRGQAEAKEDGNSK